MTPDSIREFYDYMYATFDKVWQCIMQLTDAQFVEDIDYGMGSIRNHVVHLMSTDRRWLSRVQQVEVPENLPFTDFTTRASTKAAYDEIRAQVLAYVNSLTQAQLDEAVVYSLPHRGIIDVTHKRWQLLLHNANHATDHRAQLLLLLNQRFGI